MRGVVANIDRSLFDVRLFLFPHKKDEISAFLRSTRTGSHCCPKPSFWPAGPLPHESGHPLLP